MLHAALKVSIVSSSPSMIADTMLDFAVHCVLKTRAIALPASVPPWHKRHTSGSINFECSTVVFDSVRDQSDILLG